MSNAVAQHAEPTLLSHFDDLRQQDDSTKLGMWTFLATEVMFFGGMFTAYILFRWLYHGGFAEGSNELIMYAGFLNTGVLLVSSLTMALAVDEAKLGNPKAVVWFLVITMVLGSIFLGVKAFEYTTDYFEHLIPGLDFHPEGLIKKLTEEHKLEGARPRQALLRALLRHDRAPRPAHGDRDRGPRRPGVPGPQEQVR